MLAASEAREMGYGGVSRVSRACGLSRVTITKAIQELDEPPLAPGRIRRPGGGRPALLDLDPDLVGMLEGLVEPLSRGDPDSPLRWTSKSTRTLAAELTAQDHPISHEKVAQLLRTMDYSLQGNRKTEEGNDHPDRDAQFLHINEQVRRALRRRTPVVSVDTKKKELIGNYRNGGTDFRPKGQPLRVDAHDFEGDGGKGLPYGVYDEAANNAWVSVGITHDTAEFAVASIRSWRERMDGHATRP